MQHLFASDYDDLSHKVASLIAAQITLKPESVLGLATGSTPMGAYRLLVQWHRCAGLSFSKVRTVNLDEYCGLGPDHPQSYRYYMQHNLFSLVDISPDNTHIPNGLAEDPDEECKRYDHLICDLGGIDLLLLGLGDNGHIGFNEPDCLFGLSTHLAHLTPCTLKANSRFFSTPEEIPRQAYTMGIRSIMEARHIILAVSDRNRAGTVAAATRGFISPELPASILQLHPNLTVVMTKPDSEDVPDDFRPR